MGQETVLVTGASGFIAKHCMAELLRQGYRVRGTVRSRIREPEIRAALKMAGVAEPDFEIVEADLEADAGWADAVDGCTYVLHVASPFPTSEPRNPETLLGPARGGAIRVIEAAAAAGVRRVVQTSSIAAVMACGKPDHVALDEDDWTDTEQPGLSTYARSKTLAERAAWAAIEQQNVRGRYTELAVVNPGFVLGPALDRDLSTSHNVIRMIGRGSYPMMPRIAFPIVDVRDVAVAHVQAMVHPAAAGHRWICADATMSLPEIARVMGEALPDLKRRIPSVVAPSSLLRVAALFDRNLRSIRADLDRYPQLSSERVRSRLGVTFRSSREATIAAAKSLRKLGIF